ncbi:hypothetical protein KO504_16940 [Winogradskyella psychrotolerans]|uniref:hypothetical protein n=1 Tax=Winogradskyella psychrotolerans TaxID=1344585 RepID=UPI001C06BF50|nr:hypothetical protein [Winogradskyella psychrotolerans]MBU2923038.1 hypothetical protein [Winogradskyella psychrotolerans]
MKKLLLIALLFAFSCSGKSASNVEVGMSPEKVIEVAGEPKNKSKMFGAEMYFYEDHVIVIEKDKVKSIKTMEEYGKALENL